MAITYTNIGGAEPSTLTFRVGTVQIARGSTNEQQEILVVGDPQTSNAMARVVAAAPLSTEFGLVVRIASGPSSAADLPVQISGNSTVMQGTSPWVIAGNSTVVILSGTITTVSSVAGIVQIQGNSTVVVASGNSSVIITSGNSSVVVTSGNLTSTCVQGTNPWIIAGNSTVAPLAGSTWATRPIQSSAADLQMTATQGTNPWIIAGNSTVAPLAGSTWNTRTLQSSAADLQMTATPAAGSTWNTRTLQSSAADLQMTATPLAGSTWNVRPIQSSQADLRATVYQSSASEFLVTATIGGNLQSSLAPSSGSSGLVVRQVIDTILTTSSTNAFASTTFTIQSSGAALRSYVTAYSITSTGQTASKVCFYSSGVMLWPVVLAALSSAVTGVNLAVSAPAYLFRTIGANDALTLQTGGSTGQGFKVGVSYFRAP